MKPLALYAVSAIARAGAVSLVALFSPPLGLNWPPYAAPGPKLEAEYKERVNAVARYRYGQDCTSREVIQLLNRYPWFWVANIARQMSARGYHFAVYTGPRSVRLVGSLGSTRVVMLWDQEFVAICQIFPPGATEG